MRKGPALLVASCVIVFGCGRGEPLKPFRSDAFGFSADMPGQPGETKATMSLWSGKAVPIMEYSAVDADTTYSVVLNRWPSKDIAYKSPEVIYAEVQNDVLAKTGCVYIEGKKLFQQEQEAREFLGARFDKTKYTRGRLLMLRPNVYRFFVVGPKASVESARATQFLDSARALAGPNTMDPDFSLVGGPELPPPVITPAAPGVAVKAKDVPASAEPPKISDVQVSPAAIEKPLPAKKWRVDDLDVASLGEEKDVLPCPVWSPDGKAFYLLSKNAGVLRRVTLDGLVEAARLEIGHPCSWLSMSSQGLLVVLPNLQEVWVVDPSSLEVLKKIPSASVMRVTSSPSSTIAIATPQAPNNNTCGRLELLDVGAAKSLGVFDSLQFGTAAGFAFASLSPDGKFLYTLGATECILRFRIEGSKLTLDATGPRIGQNAKDLVLSGDGSRIALPSGGGNYVVEGHPPQKYGTYVYKPAELARPVSVIESGPFPQAIGFDTKDGIVYAQNGDNELITFREGGTKLKSYRLGSGKNPVGTPVRFVPQPDGKDLLLCSESGVFLVAPAIGPETGDEPTAAKDELAPRTKPKAKAKSRTKARPKS